MGAARAAARPHARAARRGATWGRDVRGRVAVAAVLLRAAIREAAAYRARARWASLVAGGVADGTSLTCRAVSREQAGASVPDPTALRRPAILSVPPALAL